jgi:MacB-like periplasmic core domain
MKAMMTVVAGVAFSSILAAQSTMHGRPAEPYAADGVFVLRQFTVSTGQGYGTMPHEYALQAIDALGALAEVAVVGRAGGGPSYLGPGNATLITSEMSANALSLLRIRPLLGRDFTKNDLRNPTPVAILTHAAWLKAFNGRPDAVGMTLRAVGTRPAPGALIVGVLPALAPEVVPELDPGADLLILSPDLLQPSFGPHRTYAPILRLAPGVSVWQIHASMATAIAGLSGGVGGEPGTALRLETLRQK